MCYGGISWQGFGGAPQAGAAWKKVFTFFRMEESILYLGKGKQFGRRAFM